MDAEALSALLTDKCSCQEQVKAIRTTKAKGEHYTQQAEVRQLTSSVDDQAHGVVLATFDLSRGGVAKSDGTYVNHAKARDDVVNQFQLVKRDGAWLIAQIDSIK
jgi:hypothetical protein